MKNNENTKIIVSKTSGKAIASLILSLICLYGLGSLIAIILGHMARAEIKKVKKLLQEMD